MFDESADDYLRGDRHWGCDLDVITRCANGTPELSVVEFGSGYCWHLANLVLLTSSKVKRIVGIDYSREMLRRAKVFLEKSTHFGCGLSQRVELLEEDMLSTSLAAGSCDLLMMLNNTLGNLPGPTFTDAEQERRKALIEAHRVLSDNGQLVLTVYHAEQMRRESAYGEVFELDEGMSDFSAHDYVVRYRRTATPCYSHWFEEGEARTLLGGCGFEVTFLETRLERLVFVCRKIQRGGHVSDSAHG